MKSTGLQSENFKQLPRDGNRFEALVCHLLKAMGYRILKKPAVGTEGGCDILVELTSEDKMMGERREKVVVQCKHYAGSGRAIGDREVGVWQNAMTRYKAHGYLLVTDTRVTENLRCSFREFTEAEANFPKWARFWDVDEIILHLSKHPDVRDSFFPQIPDRLTTQYATECLHLPDIDLDTTHYVMPYMHEAVRAGLDMGGLPEGNRGAMLECIVRHSIGQYCDHLSLEHRETPSVEDFCRLFSYLGWYMFSEGTDSCDAEDAALLVSEVLSELNADEYSSEQVLDWLADTVWLHKTSRGAFEFRDSYIVNVFAAMELRQWFSKGLGSVVLLGRTGEPGYKLADDLARWQQVIIPLAGILPQDDAVELLEFLLEERLIQLAGRCIVEGQPIPQPIAARVTHELLTLLAGVGLQ